MGFEKEFASYEPLRRILDSPKVQNLQNRLRIRKKEEQQKSQEFLCNLIHKDDLTYSDFLPDYIIAIDGSFQTAKAENGYPGAEFGYITIASVLIKTDLARKFAKQEFINPKNFRETEKSSTVECVIPGCNVIIEGETSAKTSMRKTLFEELQNNIVFSEGETLLDTYEALLKIKLHRDEQEGNTRKPRSPIEYIDKAMTYGFGQYYCPHTSQPLFSTDAMRLHELLNQGGSSGEMYGQIMSMFEKIWLIHILRAFEKKGWLPILQRVAIILDGPLACFSTWSWLNKSIISELRRINELQKKVSQKDLLILGIEKSGTFYNHFLDLDTTPEGIADKFTNQSALLLTDNYIKNNIIFSQESKHQYGEDTYFGRKLFYKTKTAYKVIPVVATYNDYQKNLNVANPDQFPRLPDVMNLLDELVSSRYPNSLSPLVTAHGEASIPLNLGKRIFEDIAREIREKSLAK